jgi:hypothetical protein
MLMLRQNRQLPTIQLDLFQASSPHQLNWPGLPAEVQEHVTRLIVRMLSQHEPANPAVRRDGGGDDE